MNRGWLIGGLAGVVLLAGVLYLRGQGSAAPGGDSKDKRTIQVAGSASMRVKPDSARVFFGVETLGESVKGAREDNNRKVKAVHDALVALKIPNLKAKSSDVQVQLVKSRERDDTLPRVIGYRVTHTFTVLVQNDDVDKLSAVAARILDTALESGANTVEHITFFKQNDKDARREALTKAVEEATANARALAAGAKAVLRDTVTIHGQPDYNWGNTSNTNLRSQVALGGPGGGEDAPLVAGDLVITCTVNVTCTY